MRKTYSFITNKIKKEIHIKNISNSDSYARMEFFWQLVGEKVGVISTPEELSPHVLETQEAIDKFLRQKRGLWLLAFHENKVIGEVDIIPYEAARLAHVAKLTIGVLRDYQGFGVGRFLMMEALNYAQENAIERLELSVFKSNEKAISMYRKLGFVVEGEKKNFLKLSPNNYETDVLMVKFLGLKSTCQ